TTKKFAMFYICSSRLAEILLHMLAALAADSNLFRLFRAFASILHTFRKKYS
ncbi:hypothetical protein ACJX0J_036184, partial [Zea mays]